MTNCRGNTGLHMAKEFGYHELVDYLIEKGANSEIRNVKGFAAIEGMRAHKEKDARY